MHRPSQLQAELDAQSLRRRDVERRFVAAAETYTAMGARPGRALATGLGVGLVLMALVAVLSIAAATRAAGRAAHHAAGAATAVSAEHAPSTRSPGQVKTTGAWPTRQLVTTARRTG
jgi:hypothetical protein